MSFIDAIKSGYAGYVGFSGRTSRSGFWYWTLYQVIVQIILAFAFGGGQAVDGGFTYNANPVALIWSLAHLLPGIAVSIRRLHDTDRSGWWMLIGIVPLVGWIWILVYYVQRGTQGSNRFGADTLSQASSF